LGNAQLTGINLSGAEFGSTHLPGRLNKDYVYPTREDLVYFHGLGMRLVRLPFRWERIQHQPNGPLDAAELSELHRVVAWARELDMCVLLDLHNFGTYQGQVLGSDALPASALTEVWLRLLREFPDPNTSAFGLMNEPAALSPSAWIKTAQDTVTALRHAGASNLLVVASGRWSGAHEWSTSFNGVSSADAFKRFQDPLNRFAIELHQYADSNFSGTGTSCISGARLRDVLGHVTDWAKREKKQLLLGEFGVSGSPDCLDALTAILESLQDSHVWLGWAYWSSGRWWGSYPFSVQPGLGPEAPQLTVMRNFLHG
jgi:endoglucanase